ncbi:MarR family protein [Streptoalloteichus tenebrarius]|uniref:MarR family protein n=1 Tax=Streptoalloteichus tenebrarius (strain ATCC 17920 / DSM 40477 / JCM 4838 / CBS 697.72 / NBRC 16177 / NCIMB 11028 / NRRL B-12390 / A12253. 1 / ISP 5477) TaxID=1933 RepID=A0ABT1I0Z0_STRSD|nr:MarR family transcriptional regulator [Streptoalloteichus tenebrarius]MCP2261416.1 MarR family protein [Streptoalloteichus tenebrarius]BFF02020.1 helix-turn-helix domain-containing protein [Streptoalloteichus tenebrarius]
MPGERLTQQDRRQIAAGLRDGLTYAAIGRRIGRPTSTVTREVMRNGGPGGYHADRAHRASTHHARQRGTSPLPPSPESSVRAERPGPGRRDPRVVNAVAAHTTELFVQTGLPRMMARVLAALLTTDSGSLTSAELVRRLRVSPASVSKAVGYLEARELIRRERDPHRRAERYVIDDDVWYQAIMASARVDLQIAAACGTGAQRLGVGTPAGARLENMSRFLHRVSGDLVRSAQHWRQVYATHPPAETSGDATTG